MVRETMMMETMTTMMTNDDDDDVGGAVLCSAAPDEDRQHMHARMHTCNRQQQQQRQQQQERQEQQDKHDEIRDQQRHVKSVGVIKAPEGRVEKMLPNVLADAPRGHESGKRLNRNRRDTQGSSPVVFYCTLRQTPLCGASIL